MKSEGIDLESVLLEAERTVSLCSSLKELEEVRVRYLGRKSPLAAVLRAIGQKDEKLRAKLGRESNQAKKQIEQLISVRKAALEVENQVRSIKEKHIDVTLPGAVSPLGSLHPVTQMEREMCDFFTSLGYSIEDGPEVDTDYNNFTALNFPDDHPARDTQDTLFVNGGNVLRTHTSNIQIRTMIGRQPPFRFIAPGRVYRHDMDPTHYPMFHQLEAFYVDERVTFADLKGTLYAFASNLFGADIQLRFRAHFFPFTEPSAEMDFWWNDQWLEWGGCGMIHPSVLRNTGIDPERYQGFAFGVGIDRTAMLRFGIPNIHLLFEGDVRVLGQIG